MLVKEAFVQVPVSCGRTVSADTSAYGRQKAALVRSVSKHFLHRVGKGYLPEIYNVIYFPIR
jgi:N-methylhydantoinase A/oxoprolinase/acetone carboxylase beta subunit